MNLDVTIFWPGTTAPWVRPWLTAMERGLKSHGMTPRLSDYRSAKDNPNVDCDLAIFWSYRPTHIKQRQRDRGKDFLVMERGYVGDRQKWTSLGFNGLNGNAEFHADDMPSDRWNKNFKDLMQPWKKGGKEVLLIGQVTGDMSVAKIDVKTWLKQRAQEIRETLPYGHTIIYRPHPIDVQRDATY